LYKLGRVLHVSSSGRLIVRGETKPNLGDKVTNDKGKSIGVVFDVFGPTNAPYVSVKTEIDKPHRLINRTLYASRRRRRGRR